MQLILVRHGQPARKDLDHPEGPPLSELGVEQARIVADRVAAERPDVLVSSHLARAYQTAEPSAARLGLEVHKEPDISEIDGDGVPYIFVEDLRAKGGEAWVQFLKDPIGTMGGDEAKFRARVRNGFNRIIETFEHNKKVAVFSHGFPINLMVGDAVGSNLFSRLAPDYCSISRFHVRGPNKLHLLSFNEIGHFHKEAS